MIVGLGGMLGACLLGVPLAYCTARYVIKGRSIIATLAVMALVSLPFIGAYSWIVVLGNGWLTLQLKSLGINMPTIYGGQRHHSCVQPEVFPVRLSDDRERPAQHQPLVRRGGRKISVARRYNASSGSLCRSCFPPQVRALSSVLSSRSPISALRRSSGATSAPYRRLPTTSIPRKWAEHPRWQSASRCSWW